MFGSKKNSNDNNGMYETTIIGKDLYFNGNIVALKNIRLDGNMEGNINCKSNVIIGKTGTFTGEIIAQNIEVYGNVSGKLKAIGILEIKNTAYVKGEICANNFIAEEGAKIYGNCDMQEVNMPDVFENLEKNVV